MTDGKLLIDIIPESVREKNHTIINGPNALATFSVPFLWKINNRIAMNAAMRIRISCLIFSSAGISNDPSTALRILIDGVITPSPMRSDIPIKEKNVTNDICRPDFNKGTRISFKTIVPPSPLFPRLIASQAYSIFTSMINVQTIRDETPMTLYSVGLIRRKMTVSVYIGLVPISPNTRPRDLIIPLTGDSLFNITPPQGAKEEQ